MYLQGRMKGRKSENSFSRKMAKVCILPYSCHTSSLHAQQQIYIEKLVHHPLDAKEGFPWLKTTLEEKVIQLCSPQSRSISCLWLLWHFSDRLSHDCWKSIWSLPKLELAWFSAEYAQVLKMLGNGRLEAMCIDGIKRLCHIRGKMRKKVWVNTVSFLSYEECHLSFRVEQSA